MCCPWACGSRKRDAPGRHPSSRIDARSDYPSVPNLSIAAATRQRALAQRTEELRALSVVIVADLADAIDALVANLEVGNLHLLGAELLLRLLLCGGLVRRPDIDRTVKRHGE